jgi:hypothetical protein
MKKMGMNFDVNLNLLEFFKKNIFIKDTNHR